MQDDHEVRLVREGALAVIALGGGLDNYWTLPALTAFSDHLTDLNRTGDCRCLIVTGGVIAEDSAAFCRGLAPSLMADGDVLTGASLNRLFAASYTALRRFPGVTIAAVNGPAVNEGVALALNCDFRLATVNASFQFTAGSSGLLPFGGSTQLLPRLVGESWAKRLMLFEHAISAAQAEAIGLVDEVCQIDRVEQQARQWSASVLKQSPKAMRATKQLIEHARMRPLETGFAAEREWAAQLIDAGDYREARQAQLEIREPNWSDL
ncbi:enoyl-CoA hydratase-related protein [Marinobacter caseinilyticus]|uniref:enoyl-CoA hydratase-related protein n=1 Tax=Marinobacter caseinilyticus TaxID=2692195 RepID=UPI00140C41E5|nr:enoyl-CoA hydratase-related protein [Marinobacter caseinilyticus]